MLAVPVLGDIKLPDDPAERKDLLKLENKVHVKKNFLNVLQDVLLLPYGCTIQHGIAPGLSPYSFHRIASNEWKAAELQRVSKNKFLFLS